MFKPKKGEMFYYISRTLAVKIECFEDTEEERKYTEKGNCFKTKEEAEIILEKMLPFFPIEKEKPKVVYEDEPMED